MSGAPLTNQSQSEPTRFSQESWRMGYTFVDYATQAYLLLVGLLILFFHGQAVVHWPWLLLAHVIAMALVHWLVRTHAQGQSGPVLGFLRHFYPVLLYTGFYRETGELNQMFVTGYLDPCFIRLDGALFSYQPSLTFMGALPFLAVSELLYAAYFSYYIMIVGVGMALFIRDREHFFHYVSVVSFVFYVCYVCYIFLPVMGPRIFSGNNIGYHLPVDLLMTVPPVPTAVQSGPFCQVMAVIYRHLAGPGAAFPSSHVAVAIATLSFSFIYLKPIRAFHTIAVILLCVSTVYCRYHYVVDVIAGIAAAIILVPLGHRLYAAFLTHKQRSYSR